MTQHYEDLVKMLTIDSSSSLKNQTLKVLLKVLSSDQSSSTILLDKKHELPKIFTKILQNSQHETEHANLAMQCLINATSNSDSVCDYLISTEPELIRSLWRSINDDSDQNIDFSTNCAMLMSNLTRDSKHCKSIFDRLESLATFLTKSCKNAGKADHKFWGFSLNIVRNLTQLPECRMLLIDSKDQDQNEPLLSFLLPLTNLIVHESRRSTVVDILRNCCFDYDNHEKLIKIGDDFLVSLIYPLAGPEELSESENETLPLDLQYMTPDKKREPERDIRMKILEALYQLCSTKLGREFLREKGTYYILREYHKSEKDEECDNLLFNVINVLIRTEHEVGTDNLHELDVEELKKYERT